MTTVRSISEKQLEANRRNACQSTGPKTEAGKDASRLNAVTHGLLANTVVITTGDYQEDAQEFAQLLEDLREQSTPVGVAEDLEVQKIALYYWRTMRVVRYEHAAIRTRTGNLRARAGLNREEDFERDLHLDSNVKRNSYEIQSLIDALDDVKQEVLDGTLSGESRQWLDFHFADEFPLPDETEDAVQRPASLVVSPDEGRQMVAKIDEQLRRLASARAKVAAIEEQNIDAKILAAALPGPAMMDKLTRYETSNERALDRTLHRLDGMQARRRKPGGAPTQK
jgi:hypothetical protein